MHVLALIKEPTLLGFKFKMSKLTSNVNDKDIQ